MAERSIEEIRRIVNSNPDIPNLPDRAEDAIELSEEDWESIENHIVNDTDLTLVEIVRAYPEEDGLQEMLEESLPEDRTEGGEEAMAEADQRIRGDRRNIDFDFNESDLEDDEDFENYDGPMGQFLEDDDELDAPMPWARHLNTRQRLEEGDEDDIDTSEPQAEEFKERNLIHIESAPLPISIPDIDEDDFRRSLNDIITVQRPPPNLDSRRALVKRLKENKAKTGKY